MPAAWYAISLMSNREQKAKRFLDERRVPCFLPVYLTASRRRDRTRTLERPLFPGYLFVHLDIPGPLRIEVLRCPGVVDFLRIGQIPAPVPDEVIDSLMILTGAGRGVVNPHPLLTAGRRVAVCAGPFNGATGILHVDERHQARLVVQVELMGRAVSVPVGLHEVTPLLDGPPETGPAGGLTVR
jgi:transcription antitermination factor NusG